MKESMQDFLDNIHQSDFEILCEIDRICRENDIRYFLHGGTLLGSVRHQDFIPWDDDVDLVFFRDDYEKFVKLFRTCSDSRFDLIDFADYSEFFDFISKITDTSVTIDSSKAENEFYHHRYSHPCVDLFVFDEPARFFRWQLFRLRFLYSLAMGHRPGVDYKKYRGLQRVGAYILPFIGRFIPMRFIARRYSAISRGNNKGSDSWFISNDQQNKYWGRLYKKEWYVKTQPGYIRGKEFPCQAGADAQLRMTYGDYMLLPPEEERIPEHFKILKHENEDI